MKMSRLIPMLAVMLSACGESSVQQEALVSKPGLGEALFHDVNLSLNRSQSCASCHNPEVAFIDNRLDASGEMAAVSLGDDGASLGDRNSPSLTYAQFSPNFHIGTRSRFNKQKKHKLYEGALGGQFHDGRERDLAGQAGGPPLNPLEMNMPDKAAVIERLAENTEYISAFTRLYGVAILDDTEPAYSAMTEAIAAFEKTGQFASFDSKYDRFLRGNYTMSFMELTGKALFFSQFTNCAICHQLHSNGDPINKFKETFSGYEYHNIGIPVNTSVRVINQAEIDLGLFQHPQISDISAQGKFKTPTLRNVAVTRPYMHNGVFNNLKTVIEFYDHFVNPTIRAINPETGLIWAEPEVDQNISANLLNVGDAMSNLQVDALVCFLRTLTDQRFEHLIEDKGISCGE